MKKRTYLFVGDRFNVLRRALDMGLEFSTILCMKNSYLEKELRTSQIRHQIIDDKNVLINILTISNFDVLVSNGCPYILPVSSLRKAHQIFINIHPALLPLMRGPHPVNAALLFHKGAGATCHVMDDTADGGPVISRIEIPITEDLDLGLLYQLAFMAEADVFSEAVRREFLPDTAPLPSDETIYYKRADSDMILDLSCNANELAATIRAFGVKSQGARFLRRGMSFKVIAATRITNDFLLSRLENYAENEVILNYGDTIVVRKGREFLKMVIVEGDMSTIPAGSILA